MRARHVQRPPHRGRPPRPRHADGDGDRARHRQRRVPRHPGRPRCPARQQPLARRLGLSLALGIRIGLLLAISWIMGLTAPFFSVLGRGISGRDLILLGGGLFLIAKATWEIYDKVEAGARGGRRAAPRGAFALVLVQILLIDIVFSLDSVITAVGMANDISIMVIAMVLSMLVMLVSAGAVSDFVEPAPERQDPRAGLPAPDRRDAGRRGPRAPTWTRATSTSRWRSRCSWRCSTSATGRSAAPASPNPKAAGRTARRRRPRAAPRPPPARSRAASPGAGAPPPRRNATR